MIKSLNHFEAIIGYQRSDIYKAIENLDSYYYHFEKVKSSGKIRHFYPSEKILKDIQNRLVSRVFKHVIFPYFITGSVKGRSSTLNAKLHSGYLFHLLTDLSSYFDFVSNKRVYTAFIDIGFSPDVASLITKLTTYKGHLPQGAPTSPFVANLVGLKIDYQVIEVCKEYDIMYTRYVDDLTFSSHLDFKEQAQRILGIINSLGFSYNHKKTCYKIGDIEVTGAVSSCNGIYASQKQMDRFRAVKNLNSKAGLKCYIDYIDKLRHQKNLGRYRNEYDKLVVPQSIRAQGSIKVKECDAREVS